MSIFNKNLFLRIFAGVLILVSLASCSIVQQQIGLTHSHDIPIGEYKGTAKAIGVEDAPEITMSVNFLPKEEGMKDAIGILVFDNISERFMWRNDGNNKNLWNVLFSKDNTVFSDIRESFEFSGIVKHTAMRNTIEGKLKKIIEDKITPYYIKGEQVFKPSLQKPKEAIVVKAGEGFSINAETIDPAEITVYLENAEGKEEELEIETSSEKKGIHTLSFLTSKDTAKGKYKIFVKRADGEVTKKLGIEVQ